MIDAICANSYVKEIKCKESQDSLYLSSEKNYVLESAMQCIKSYFSFKLHFNYTENYAKNHFACCEATISVYYNFVLQLCISYCAVRKVNRSNLKMDVTNEQYRARNGMHDSVVKTRELASHA